MPPERSHRIYFGDFAADISCGELYKEDVKIRLQAKPFQILSVLLQRPRELVSRKEIISKVWPDTFVEGDLCLNVAVRRLRSALSHDASDVKYIETVGSQGYRFIADVSRSGPPEAMLPSRDRPRVAVFPFEASDGLNCDSFASAMTQLVIVEIRRMHPSLSVVAPEFMTEPSRKKKGKLARCREVSADYMLVGELSESDGQIRIIMRLLKCRTQTCVWGDSYTHPKRNLFTNQVGISRKIAASMIQSIPVSIRPSHLESVPAVVYEKYLQACSLRSRLSEDALSRCVLFLEAAVRECPQFSLAWTALSNAHCMEARLGIAPSGKAFPLVKSCADKALAIEDHAEGRTALAYYQFFYEHDWEAAEASLLRALALDARCPLAVGGYAQLLAATGRHEEAVFLMRQACELEPFASYPAIMFGWALYYAGKYAASLAQLSKAMELDSSLWIGHTSAGMALERLGKMEAAVAEFRLALEYSDNSSLAKAHVAYGLARMGDKGGATEILNVLLKLRQKQYFSPYWLALIYVALDQISEAMEWLEIAAKERCGWIVFAREDPKFAVLHADPRFHRVVSGISPPRGATCPA
jgi:DNA-binding winged helix-turn-helix (wHTH) protein/tetratricopeptide (TPR) repeat protein